MLYPGQIFDKKYEIIKTLGSGGMGTVYLARNINLNNFWAVKEVNKKLGDKVDLLAEPNMLKKLNHPLLPRIFDILQDTEHIYIIEDYIEGIPLDKELQRCGRFPEKQVVEWAKQICDAMVYLHSQKPNPVIYRDMKPSNLIVSPDNKVKIIDFGIAREYKKEASSDTNYIGTKGYAAPEQYGAFQSDARTDIYSLGVTLYHLITGKSPNEAPFEIKPVRELNARLSRGIEYILLKCTRQDPQNRYQSVEKLLSDLNNISKFDIEYRRRVFKRDATTGALLISLILFIILAYKGWNQIGQERIDGYNNLISQGIFLMNEGRYDEAISYHNSALNRMPGNPEAFKEIAMVYLTQGDYAGVIEYIDNNMNNYIEAFKDNRYAWVVAEIDYILGTAYYEKADYENALMYMSRAEISFKWDVAFKRNYAVASAKNGRYDDAERILDEARALGMYDDSVAYVSGEISFQKGNYIEAAGFFIEALNNTNDEDIKRRSFIALAESYRVGADVIPDALDLEINVLNRALNELRDKGNIVILESLGNAYSKKAHQSEGEETKKYYTLSVAQFEQLLVIGYKRPYIMRNIAILYQNAGMLEEAESALWNMMESFPDEYSAYMQMAFLYADMESKKDNDQRDYARTLDYYELAVLHYKEAARRGVDDPQMKALDALIDELKAKDWIS